MARQLVVCLAVTVFGVVLGANVYNSVVDATSWGAHIPESLSVAKQYYALVNPGAFYRVASPLAQVLALLVLIICRRIPGARSYAAVALVTAIVADLLTFGYFYPRNAIIMGDLKDVAAVTRAWREWTTMNHVRSALVLGAPAAELIVLMRVAQRNPPTAG